MAAFKTRKIITVKPSKPKAVKKKGAENPATIKMRAIARAKVLDSNAKPVDVGKALMDTMQWIPKDEPVTIFMSGGIDSHACLFAALSLKLNVNIASFTMDTHESSDFKAAKHAATTFGLKFYPIILKSSEKELKNWVLFAVNVLKQTKKSAIECMWPLYRGLEHMQGRTKHVVFGINGDNYFLMTKRLSMHCKDLVSEARRYSFRKAFDQNDMLRREAWVRGMYTHLPFSTDGRIYAELQLETDFHKINKPQKSFLHAAFPKLHRQCKIKQHQNFQLGDSNISGIFAQKLLKSDWNINGFKSSVGIYNAVASGKIKGKAKK